MDFTREPIIETIITPREGCKLAVRSSKASAQEEYFVDALEVVSFGNSFFFRSMERPKSFLVPVTDYEVLEVREARMVLKNTSSEKPIKIAGGREKTPQKEPAPAAQKEEKDESRNDKRRDRRRSYRRRGRRDEDQTSEEMGEVTDLPPSEMAEKAIAEEPRVPSPVLSKLLPPPSTLISETIQRYKQDDLYKEAFFEEREAVEESVAIEEMPSEPIEEHISASEEDKQD